MASDPELVVFLQIGTNNIGGGHSARETSDGIMTIATWLLSRTRCLVLLGAMLPRFWPSYSHPDWWWEDWKPVVDEGAL
jgi:hypothetical protein